jgi:uncharacterized membrane protein YphA (DoxX/SURF4 family)
MAQAPWTSQLVTAIHKAELLAEEKLTKKARQRVFRTLGPFLLVVTFIEDSLRILFRWSEQKSYLTSRMGMNGFFAVLSLLISVVVQVCGTGMILRPEHFKPRLIKQGSYTLLGFVMVQPFLYGQATDLDFMCRSVTLAGGFLLLIWSENEKERRSESSLGLPQGPQGQGADRLQLFGRGLLTLIFLFQAVYDENGGLHSVMTSPGFFNICSALLLLALSAMVCVGLHTEWSAIGLSVVLFISNVYMYPFWRARAGLVDFYKYYFFQNLSVIGGLMLLALHGPGGISLEGAKKGL